MNKSKRVAWRKHRKTAKKHRRQRVADRQNSKTRGRGRSKPTSKS